MAETDPTTPFPAGAEKRPDMLRVQLEVPVGPEGQAATRERISELTRDIGGHILGIIEVPDSEHPYERLAGHPGLDTDIASALAELLIPPDSPVDEIRKQYARIRRLCNPLERHGIKEVRDLLVMGKQRMLGIRTIGPTYVEILKDVITDRLGPSATWLDEPDASDAARLCSDLGQVTQAVIGDVAGCSNVQEVLDTPPGDRNQLAPRRQEKEWGLSAEEREQRYIAEGEAIYADALAYAEKFERARAELAPQRASE